MQAVHWVVHRHFSLLEGESLLMNCLARGWDTLQVLSHVLAEMSLTAIRKLEIPPQYHVAIQRSITQKHCCNLRRHPTVMQLMQSAINEYYIL